VRGLDRVVRGRRAGVGVSMLRREIKPGVWWVGALDWHRQHFDELVPLPYGTSYNAYLVEGNDKTVLLDTVDPAMTPVLFERLAGVKRLDYLVAHHAEQDHSGAIPAVLARFPEAKVLASPKGVTMLQDHLALPADKLAAVADGETLDLGGRALRFMHMPWVHWPETMVSRLGPQPHRADRRHAPAPQAGNPGAGAVQRASPV
jgi:flavorubredoxin